MPEARLTPISGCGAKGPACFLVETGDARLLLDLGYGPQPGLWPDVSGVGTIDALLLSHSHNDHAGGLKLLGEVGTPRIFATDIVRGLVKSGTAFSTLPLRGAAEVCGIRVTTGRNGHAPGGIWLHLDVAGGLLYMGDYSAESLLYAYDPPPQAGTVILDASYGDYDVPMSECVSAFDAVFDVPPVLLPVPAAGRGPEMALHLARSGRELPRIDDAMRTGLASLLGESRACLRPGVEADLARLQREAPPIDGAHGVMLAVVADAASGAASRLVSRWEGSDSPAIVFTGYRPPGTPADRLTQSGRAQYLRWNVHARLSDNTRLVRETGARTVLPAFGDARHRFTWQSAFGPAHVTLQGPVAL